MWACGEPSQASASETPPRPRTSRPIGMSTTWKPVPKISASTSSSRPSPVTIDRARTSRTPLVTSSTFERRSAGYQSLDGRMRLQPRCSRASCAAISPGSRSERSRCRRRPLEQLHPARLLDEARARAARAPRRSPPRTARWANGRRRYTSRSTRRHRPRAVRHHPRRRALEDVQLLDDRTRSRARTGSPTRPSRSRPRAYPRRSTEWSQRAECIVGPSKADRPGRSGIRGSDERPGAGDEHLRGHRTGRCIKAPAPRLFVP